MIVGGIATVAGAVAGLANATVNVVGAIGAGEPVRISVDAPTLTTSPSAPTPPDCGDSLHAGAAGEHYVGAWVKSAARSSVTCWSHVYSPANPGERMTLMIDYFNPTPEMDNDVVVKANLAPHMQLVPHTTRVYTSETPDGVLDESDNIANGGLIIGNYAPRAGAYITFQIDLDLAGDFKCGETKLTAVLIAHPKVEPEYYNTAAIYVENPCRGS